ALEDHALAAAVQRADEPDPLAHSDGVDERHAAGIDDDRARRNLWPERAERRRIVDPTGQHDPRRAMGPARLELYGETTQTKRGHVGPPKLPVNVWNDAERPRSVGL